MKVTIKELKAIIKQVIKEETTPKRNLKDVVINIPDEGSLRLIQRTPTFQKYFNPAQLKGLGVGDNKITLNNFVYGRLKDQYPEGSKPFGIKD